LEIVTSSSAKERFENYQTSFENKLSSTAQMEQHLPHDNEMH